MKTLFIDTHLNDILVFLLDDGKVIKQNSVIGRKNNSEVMFSTIKEVIDGTNLDEIIVVNGPGSFTSVRLGVTIAKTLAYTLNIPIKTISSLEVSAISNNTYKVSISDGNGCYLGEFNKKYKPIKDYIYVNNSELINIKNLEEYNQTQEVANGEKPKLPYIIIIVDEMNDLMSTNKKEIEDRVIKLAQKSRAAGIHLILATQRPSVDVITGTIKANLPSRIAFAVTSNVDSKTILDGVGAEKLLGRGDMLYSPREYPEPVRIQGAYCSNEEIKAVVDFVKSNNEAIFDEQAEREINAKNHSENGGYVDNSEEMDPLLPDALKFFIEIKQASISKLQRMFSIGFNRAGKIVDQMEKLHYVSPQDGSRPRSVYITMEKFMEIYGDKY